MLRQRPFRRLWLAQLVSLFGDFLALFGVISLITFHLHGTAIQVMAVSLSYMLPMTIVGPVAGVLVDRWNVKRVMVASDLVRAGLVVLLVFATDTAQICAIFAVLATVSSFFLPAQLVTLRTMVAPEALLSANALMSQAYYSVNILSPMIAGVIVSWFSERVCFYLDSFSFLFSATMLSTLVILRSPSDREKTVSVILRQISN